MPLTIVEALKRLTRAEELDSRNSVESASELVLDSYLQLQSLLPDGYPEIVRQYCFGTGIIEAMQLKGSLPFYTKLRISTFVGRLALLAAFGSAAIGLVTRQSLAWWIVPVCIALCFWGNSMQSRANLWIAAFCLASRRQIEVSPTAIDQPAPEVARQT